MCVTLVPMRARAACVGASSDSIWSLSMVYAHGVVASHPACIGALSRNAEKMSLWEAKGTSRRRKREREREREKERERERDNHNTNQSLEKQ